MPRKLRPHEQKSNSYCMSEFHHKPCRADYLIITDEHPTMESYWDRSVYRQINNSYLCKKHSFEMYPHLKADGIKIQEVVKLTNKRPKRARRRIGGTRSQKEQVISIVAVDGETLHVSTPYNAKYVEAIKNSLPKNARRWNPALRLWAIDSQYKTRVEYLIKTYYGDRLVIKYESTPLQQAVFSASKIAQDMLHSAQTEFQNNADPNELLI